MIREAGLPIDAGDEASATRSVALVLVVAFMVLADISIVNTAAPAIERELGARISEIQLVVAGYQIAYAAVLVTAGRLGDLAGRRVMFIIGLACFTVASLACGLAATPVQLVAFRVGQGISAALLYPQVLATIQTVLPPQRRAGGFAALGAVVSVATIAGPVLAGLFVEADLAGTGWRAVFLVNVPIGVAGMVLARRLIPVARSPHPAALSPSSVLVLSVLLVALMVPLTIGRDHGWPGWAWLALAAVPPLAVGFLVQQRAIARRGRSPLVPPELWTDRAFRLGLALYVVFFSGVYSFFLYLSYLLQFGLGETALLAGLTMATYSVGSFVTSTLCRRLIPLWGGRRVALAGAAVSACAAALMIWPVLRLHDPTLSYWMAGPLFVAGCGLGLVVAPLLTTVLAGIRASQAGVASGLLTTGQQIGGALGVAVVGMVVLAAVPGGQVETAGALPLASGFADGLALQVALFTVSALLIAALPGPSAAVERKTGAP